MIHPLAQELNKTLEGTTAACLLSEYGKRIFFPKGIVSQASEAQEHAKRFDATIGMARLDGKAMNLPFIRNLIPELSPDEIFSYAPTPGVKELRSLWKQYMLKKNPGLEGIETSLPLVVAGITTGVSLVADMFIDPGDIIIMPDLFWDNFTLILEEKNQGRIVTFRFFDENNCLNFKALEETINQYSGGGKLVVLLNFPNNPTGYAPLKNEIEPLMDVLYRAAEKGTKILTIIDDSYFGLFYEPDIYPHSIFTQLSSLHENILAVELDGATKEYFAWGFRVGFVTFAGKGLAKEHYSALEKKMMGIVRAAISNSNRLGQSLIVRALKSESYEKERAANQKILKERYDKVKELLKKHAGESILKPLPFNSGYFMCFELKKGSTEKLRQYLLSEKQIGTISLDDKYLRIAYACVETDKMEGLYSEIFNAAKAFAG